MINLQLDPIGFAVGTCFLWFSYGFQWFSWDAHIFFNKARKIKPKRKA